MVVAVAVLAENADLAVEGAEGQEVSRSDSFVVVVVQPERTVWPARHSHSEMGA